MFRKIIPRILILVLPVVVLITAFLLKDELNNLVSEKMKQQAGVEVIMSGEAWVDSLFNYTQNGKEYQYSLLQFKSNGCTICKQMEPELEKIRKTKNGNVNVVVVNIMNRNSQNLMKYFGISAVPTQLILNKKGEEIFRNYGFISAEDILSKAQN